MKAQRYRIVLTAFISILLTIVPAGALAQKKDQKDKPSKSKGKGMPELPARKLIWKDPGAVETLDFAAGPGGVNGAPKAPFRFVEEDLGGSNPKIKVKDANGVEWTAKFGEEVKAETFSIRMVWATGYYTEPAYFLPTGTIQGATGLKRAGKSVAKDGTFNDARFEIKKEKGVTRLKDEQGWTWPDNPFVGTKELNGLKIMIMLLSNWDNKDVRDIKRGSNTAIFVTPTEAWWVFTDWGATMGAWGGYLSRSKWHSLDYEKQTKDFVKGVKNGEVQWGYSGQHNEEFWKGIPVAHVQWFMQYLGRITDAQIAAGLVASGADQIEVKRFGAAIRDRINQLRQLQALK